MGRLKGYLTFVSRGYALAAAGALALVVLVVVQRDAAAQQRGPDVYRGPQRHAPTTPSMPPAALPQRWEYAVLRFEIVNARWAWIDPENTRTGDKARIYKELGGYGRPGRGETSYVDIANQAGTLGWELTSVLEREKGTEIWFKRALR